MVTVNFTRKDISAIEQAAMARWQLARAAAIGDQRRADNDGAGIDRVGVMAEVAVARLLGADYSLTSIGIDSGIDMWVGGISIDVKGTMRPNGRLLFKSIAAFKADAAVLVNTVDGNEMAVQVMGGISKQMFKNVATMMDFGRGQTMVCEIEQLMPIQEFWLALMKRKFA